MDCGIWNPSNDEGLETIGVFVVLAVIVLWERRTTDGRHKTERYLRVYNNCKRVVRITSLDLSVQYGEGRNGFEWNDIAHVAPKISFEKTATTNVLW